MPIKFIAEIGQNHNGSLEKAYELIDTAAYCKCNYVKFQTRTPELCVPLGQQKTIKKNTPWGDISYLEYRRHLELNLYDYKYIAKYCYNKNIKWFTSVWDLESAKRINSIYHITNNESIIKIPSAKITDLQLLSYCRENFNKVLMSTGMSTEEEIETAVNIGKPDVLFHTNSVYPSPVEDLNLQYITWLQDKYPQIEIGYSGHEYGIETTLATIPLGVEWIERHICLSHQDWGSDQAASVEPQGLYRLIKGIKEIEKALDKGYDPRKLLPQEEIKLKSLRG